MKKLLLCSLLIVQQSFGATYCHKWVVHFPPGFSDFRAFSGGSFTSSGVNVGAGTWTSEYVTSSPGYTIGWNCRGVGDNADSEVSAAAVEVGVNCSGVSAQHFYACGAQDTNLVHCWSVDVTHSNPLGCTSSRWGGAYQIWFNGAPTSVYRILEPGQTATLRICTSGTTNGYSLRGYYPYGVVQASTLTGVYQFTSQTSCESAELGTGEDITPAGGPIWTSQPAGGIGSGASGGGSGYGGVANLTPGFTNAAGTNLLTEHSAQAGLGAIYNGIQNADVAARAGVQQLYNGLQGIRTDLAGIASGLGTNSGGSDLGVSNSVRRFHVDATNQLGQLYALFDKASTNQNVAGALAASMSDGAQAGVAADSALGSSLDGVESILSGLGSVPVVDEGTLGTGLQMEFFGETLDLDPEVQFPGAMGYVKALLTFVALLGFSLSMGQLFMEASKVYATAQTGGVPNLETTFLGTGGNLLGVSIAVLVPVALVAVWVAVFTLIASYFTSAILATVGVGSLDNPSTVAAYLLSSVFPVNLMISLAVTRVSAHFLMGKAIIIAASASRFLIGK